MSKANPSRSELRTLLTKAKEGLRIAKQNLDNIAAIRDGLDRKSEEYKVASKCYQVVYTTWEQQDSAVKNFKQKQAALGSRKKKNADLVADALKNN